MSGQTDSGGSTKVSLSEEGSPTDESSSHLPTDKEVANPIDLKQAKPLDRGEQQAMAKSPISGSTPEIADPTSSPKSVPVSNEEFFHTEGERNDARESSLPEEIEKLLRVFLWFICDWFIVYYLKYSLKH